jgi:hypothetical protein
MSSKPPASRLFAHERHCDRAGTASAVRSREGARTMTGTTFPTIPVSSADPFERGRQYRTQAAEYIKGSVEVYEETSRTTRASAGPRFERSRGSSANRSRPTTNESFARSTALQGHMRSEARTRTVAHRMSRTTKFRFRDSRLTEVPFALRHLLALTYVRCVVITKYERGWDGEENGSCL